MKIKGEEKTCDVPLSLIEKVSGRNMQAEENLPLEYSYESGIGLLREFSKIFLTLHPRYFLDYF